MIDDDRPGVRAAIGAVALAAGTARASWGSVAPAEAALIAANALLVLLIALLPPPESEVRTAIRWVAFLLALFPLVLGLWGFVAAVALAPFLYGFALWASSLQEPS